MPKMAEKSLKMWWRKRAKTNLKMTLGVRMAIIQIKSIENVTNLLLQDQARMVDGVEKDQNLSKIVFLHYSCCLHCVVIMEKKHFYSIHCVRCSFSI